MMVCSQMPPVYGGAGAQATLLASRLAGRGWLVTALTLDQAGVGSSCDGRVRVRRILRGWQPAGAISRGLSSLALGSAAFAHILFARPRAVHVHGAYWWSIPPVLAGRLVRARVIVKTTRDGEDDPQTVYSRRVGLLPLGWLYGLSLRLAHVVVTLSEQSRRRAIEAGLEAKVRLIPNGVDEARFTRTPARRRDARAKLGLRSGTRMVLFVGYLVRHKGIVDLLEAWRLLDDRAAQLWLVGPLDGFYRELDGDLPSQLQGLIDDGFAVRTLGHQPADTLPDYYFAADVFALPSYAEGMPNALAEALVAGCQVVATKIPGIVDLIDENLDQLITPGDVPTLAARLRDGLAGRPGAYLSKVDTLGIESVAGVYERIYLGGES
ncbi:MAG: hypothetical protein BGO95_06955 [Micrococcales bacterium 73-13]|nr:MAG: hypothetical protein BGO95_06955 [Micrococcales bacterium 73-13]